MSWPHGDAFVVHHRPMQHDGGQGCRSLCLLPTRECPQNRRWLQVDYTPQSFLNILSSVSLSVARLLQHSSSASFVTKTGCQHIKFLDEMCLCASLLR